MPAGLIFLQDYDGSKCGEPDGTDCGIIEFSLGVNGNNAINYSLLSQGNHVL